MSNSYKLLMITLLFFTLLILSLNYLESAVNYRRLKILSRLHNMKAKSFNDQDDILSRPFRERTLGYLSQRIVDSVSQITPVRIQEQVEEKLKRAGNPRGIKAGDFLGTQCILGMAVLACSLMLMLKKGLPLFSTIILSMCLTFLSVYLPWFILSVITTKRQEEIRRSLPELMDLLVINVEAGLGFDMALTKVAKRYRGALADEFKQALFEMQLGKARKDALIDMCDRVNLEELALLVNAIVQSDQLGIGLGQVLRMQSELIREKHRLWVEEQAMKAPVKILFPLVFCIFPCMFIVILGPAIIHIMQNFGK
ncbi:MAG TPA: type II secretion system F family protein [Syntrophomonadaceae bacterium]|nr:type II secretion system F family protein [Syntrophomonadaceae bacterium]